MPKPSFGGTLQDANYYVAVSNVINVLRDYSTLNVIATHLNTNGFRSPSGKPFNKSRVATFIRSPHYKNPN